MFQVYDKKGDKIKVVDAISIPWDDKDGNDETYYVRLGTFLSYIQNYLMPKCITSNGDPKNYSPLLNVDYDQNTNLMYAYKWQVGVDPRICVVGRTIKILQGLIWNTYEDVSFSGDCSPFIDPDYSNIAEGVEYGNIMNIYVSMAFILNKVDELKDEKNQTSLFDLLKGILDGINEGLGSLNSLEPVIDEVTNTIKIIDANPLPNNDDVIAKINDFYSGNINISSQLASFDLYGYNSSEPEPNNPIYNGSSHASFIKDFNFATEITPEFATMITVGAAANGSVVGANSTALSKLNIGLSDRYKKEILDSYTLKQKQKQEQQQIANTLVSESAALDALKERYNKTLSDYFDWLEELSDVPLEPTMNVADVDAYKGTILNIKQMEDQIRAKEYSVYLLNNGIDPNDPKQQQSLAPGTGFIPFNMSLTMDGLSGMKIYSKFTVDTDFLPSNYPGNVEFLIKGITHEISDNKWFTKIESFCISKGKFADTSAASVASAPGTIAGYQTGPITYLNNTTCGTPITAVSPKTFNNTSNPKYINAFNKAIYNTFRGGKGESGMCSKYTYSIASALVNSLKNQAPGPQFLSGKGNAKDASTRNFLSSLGYTVTKIGDNLSKASTQQLLNSQTYNIGDIIIYWANDGNAQDSQNKYGHIEVYSGKVWNPYNYNKSQTNFVSSVPDNYTTNPFVYGGKPNNCWTIYLCRVPNI